jgi:anti-sigma B factor antagonist
MDIRLAEGSSSGVMVMSLDGQLDIDTAPQLQAALDQLRAASTTRVVVDVAGLAFCDSIGLSALLVAARYCAESGGFLRLANPTPFLQRVCTVVGIAHALTMYRSVADASTGNPAGLLAPSAATATADPRLGRGR